MNYEEFEKRMAEKYPRYCGEHAQFGGFAIGEGWYHIIESLIAHIDHYTKRKRSMRAHQLRLARAKAKGRDVLLKHICKGKEPRHWEEERDRKSTRLNSSHIPLSRMPSSA